MGLNTGQTGDIVGGGDVCAGVLARRRTDALQVDLIADPAAPVRIAVAPVLREGRGDRECVDHSDVREAVVQHNSDQLVPEQDALVSLAVLRHPADRGGVQPDNPLAPGHDRLDILGHVVHKPKCPPMQDSSKQFNPPPKEVVVMCSQGDLSASTDTALNASLSRCDVTRHCASKRENNALREDAEHGVIHA